MTANTRTSLTNMALREIGATRIGDHTEASPSADVANDLWDEAVRKALYRHEWQWATRTAKLARSGNTPEGRYDYRYTLPAAFIRLSSISEYEDMKQVLDDYEYRAEGIETNAENIYIDYVADDVAIGAWPPYFVDLFVAEFACLMCAPLKSTTERERLEELKNMRLREAKSSDSLTQPTRHFPPGRWRRAVHGGRQRLGIRVT